MTRKVVRSLALVLISAATLLSFTVTRLIAEPKAAVPTLAGLPLAPLRPISITTDEGTWISLDVSPDGRTIAFDLLGKIFTLPIEGGRATQITWGPSFDEWPRFTRNGEHIVFSSDRGGPMELWMVPVSGGEAVVAPAADRAGVRMALEVSGANSDPATWAAIAVRPVTAGSLAAPAPPPLVFWTSDRRFGVRSTRPGQARLYSTEECAKYARASLLLVDGANGTERELADAGPDCMGGASMPQSAFTPDGHAFVTAHGGKIWRISIPAGQKSQIPFTAHVALQARPRQTFMHRFHDDPMVHARVIEHARVSPEGKRVAFGAFDRVWIQDLPNGTPRRLTRLDVGEFQPIWSPDGTEVVFTTWDSINSDGALQRVTLADDCVSSSACPVERLTAVRSRYLHPAYSPDGQHVVAMQARFGGRVGHFAAKLIAVPRNGGAPKPFGPDRNLNVEFSDLYFLSRDPGAVIEGQPLAEWLPGPPKGLSSRCVANRIPLDATVDHDDPPLAVARDGARALPPWQDRGNLNYRCAGALAPDGDRMVVREANGELFLVDLPTAVHGGERTATLVRDQAVRISPEGLGGDWPSWSPDGRKISFTFGSTLYIYDIDEGRRTLELNRGKYTPQTIRIDVSIPRNLPTGATVFRHARLVTMRGDEVIDRGDLVVRGRRIVAIGPSGTIDIPADAHLVEASGLTLIPGLLDLHNHALQQSFTAGVHDSRNMPLETNLAFGVLNSRDPQGYESEVLTIEDRIEAGVMLGARSRTTFVGVGSSSAEWIDSLARARTAVERYGKQGLGLGYVKEYTSGPRHHRQHIVMAAAEEHLNVTSHGTSLRQLLTNAIDGYGGFDHPVATLPLYDDIRQLLVLTQIAWADNNWRWALPQYFFARLSSDERSKLRRLYRPDTYGSLAGSLDERIEIFSEPSNRDGGDHQGATRMAQSLVAAVRKGARIVNGSHGDDVPGLGTHLQIWEYVEGGATPLEALRTSTIWAAEALDWSQDLGSLEVGKLADLIVLEKNPLERIQNTIALRYVMSNGRLYDAETLREVSR